MHRITLIVILGFLILAAESLLLSGTSPRRAAAADSPLPKEFIAKSITLPDKSEWKYAVYVPPQYDHDANHAWPVLLFLHGSAEVGTDGVRQTHVGLPAFIRAHADRFPFIVVMPQAHSLWFRGVNAAAAWAALDATIREYRTDRDRICVTGLSMGGFGAWELAIAQPDVFSAVVPVCGDAPDEYLGNMDRLPVWAFHGAEDPNVPVAGSRTAIKTLRELGATPKYSEYPGMGHKIWDTVYSSKALWKWVLQQHRQPPPRRIAYRMLHPSARVWWLAAQADLNARDAARITAEIKDSGELQIESQGVTSWSILSNDEPLKPGKEITLIYNHQRIFHGTFKGLMRFGPKPTSAPTSQMSESPNETVGYPLTGSTTQDSAEGHPGDSEQAKD